jgi:hypothetical protein
VCAVIFGPVVGEDSAANAYLRGGKAYSRRSIHGFKHVVNQGSQVVVEDQNLARRLMQHGIAFYTDWPNSH